MAVTMADQAGEPAMGLPQANGEVMAVIMAKVIMVGAPQLKGTVITMEGTEDMEATVEATEATHQPLQEVKHPEVAQAEGREVASLCAAAATEAGEVHRGVRKDKNLIEREKENIFQLKKPNEPVVLEQPQPDYI